MVMRNYPLSLLLVALVVSLAGKATGSVTALKEEQDRLGQAQKAYRQSHPEKAIQLAEQAREQIDAKKNPEQHLKASFCEIHYRLRYDQRHDYTALIRSAFKKGKIFRKDKPILYLRALYYKAWFKLASASGEQDYRKVLALLDKCLAHKTYLKSEYPQDLLRIQLTYSETVDRLKGTYSSHLKKAFRYIQNHVIAHSALKADVLFHKALMLKGQQKTDSAAKLFQQAVRLVKGQYSHQHVLLFDDYLGLISIMRITDQHEKLKRYCQKAYQVVTANGWEGTPKEVAVLVKQAVTIITQHKAIAPSSDTFYYRSNAFLAQCYIRLNQPHQAVSRCLSVLQKLNKQPQTATAKRIRAGLQGTLAYALQKDEQYDSALMYHQKVLAFSKKWDIFPNLQSTYVNMANVHMAQGQYEKAIAYIKKVKTLFDQSPRNKRSNYARIVCDNIAICRLNQQRYDQALQQLQKGFSLNSPVFDNPDIATFPEPEAMLSSQVGLKLAYRKGKALLGKYNQTNNRELLKLALQSFQLADQCLQQLRTANILGKNPLSITEITGQIYPPCNEYLSKADGAC